MRASTSAGIAIRGSPSSGKLARLIFLSASAAIREHMARARRASFISLTPSRERYMLMGKKITEETTEDMNILRS